IATGTPLLTRVSRHGAVVRPQGLPDALSQGPEVFETMHPVRVLSGAHNEIALHTWGDAECCLPAGATTAALRDPDQRLRLQPGDFLVLEQIRDRETGRTADADPDRRHIVRLLSVSGSRVDALMSADEPEPVRYVEVTWHAEDALPFPLWVGSGDAPLAVARGNLVLVDHGRTIETEDDAPLQVESFGNQGRLRARLPFSELTWSAGVADGVSAHAVLQHDPRRARPLVRLEGEGELWVPQRDLLGSAPSARDFVVETESDRRAWIRFGDDTMGRRPTRTTTFAATYRVGNGPRGNVGAEAIAHLVARPGEVSAKVAAVVRSVRNPRPGLGGAAPESIDAVKRYAPQAFRRQERAVTTEDWAMMAKRHPEVQRAVARVRWTGSWHAVVLVIDRMAGRPVDDAFRDELVEFLERFRLAGYDLEVMAPQLVPLDIALSICVELRHYADEVERRVLQELGTGTLADGRRGFFHPDELSFGQPVYLSQIVARIEKVPGVRWVDATPTPPPDTRRHRFKRWGRVANGELQRGRIDIGPLEIARCDNDPNLPDNGRIQFHMEGGT
ncbi:MAG: putative baseplate assembly protein, partial [Nannocystaceae bacterium]